MIDVETTDAVEVGKINDNNFDSSIVTAIDKLVGLHNGEVKVTNSGSRKTAVSARVKMNKLVRDVDTERIRVKTLVVDVVTKIAEVETAKLNPIIKNYTTAIDGYDTKIKADKDKVLADAKDLLDGRLSKLDGLVSEVELKFVDVAGMDSVVFDEFVKMRESIKAHVDVVAIDTPPAIEEEVVDSVTEHNIGDYEQGSLTDTSEPVITESEVIDGDTLVLTDIKLINTDEVAAFGMLVTRLKTLKPVAAAISTTEGIAMMDRVDDFIEMIERSIGG
jgi:hypothetical protein